MPVAQGLRTLAMLSGNLVLPACLLQRVAQRPEHFGGGKQRYVVSSHVFFAACGTCSGASAEKECTAVPSCKRSYVNEESVARTEERGQAHVVLPEERAGSHSSAAPWARPT